MTFLYLGGLLIGIAGMIVLDARFRLFFWRAPLRAAIVLVAGVAFFVAWDLVGVGAGVFFPGRSAIVTGALIVPGLPVEELFFLVLLCYTAMDLYGAFDRWSSRPRSGRVETTPRAKGGLDTRPSAATRPPEAAP